MGPNRDHHAAAAFLVGSLALAGCGSATIGTTAPSPTLAASPAPSLDATASPTPSSGPVDVLALDGILDEGQTYWVDPDFDESTSLRVLFTVPARGWASWTGTTKESDAGHAAVSIVAISNLNVDACRDQQPRDPPVGSSVEDLAIALAALPPFEVTSPAADVTIWGYTGKHLQVTVPDLQVEFQGGDKVFIDCQAGILKSWIAPVLSSSFYGYAGPGHAEEFWILDVEGTRLVVSANWSPGTPTEDLEELQAILESVRIEP